MGASAIGRHPSDGWVVLHSGPRKRTFRPNFLTRFGQNDHHADQGDIAFGSRAWRDALKQPSDQKWSFLVQAYRQSMFDAGFRYVLGFEMIDELGHQLWLVFGTNADELREYALTETVYRPQQGRPLVQQRLTDRRYSREERGHLRADSVISLSDTDPSSEQGSLFGPLV